MKKITLILSLILTAGIAMAQTAPVSLNLAATYKTGVFDEGATEIVAYDAASQQVFSTNGNDGTIDILDVSDPANITLVSSIDLSTYGDGANSVVVLGGGYIAAAVEADEFNENGKAVFFETDGTYVTDVEVGVLPDMITVSPDGNYVLTANEGEPDDDYTEDPYGSVSIIDISGGVQNVSQSDVTTLDFMAFNNNYDSDIRNFGPVADFFEDFEDTDVGLGNVYIEDVAGSAGWIYDNFSGDNFAEANGFSSDAPTEDWMVIPNINLTGLDSAYFSFENTKNFSGGTFDVLISTDFDTESGVASATWDTITDEFTYSPGGYTDTMSGKFSLEDYLVGDVSIAFLYTGDPGPGGSTLWQIDDLRIEGTRPELARNLEPEYIAVSPNSSTAYVFCQENNAVAVVNLNNSTITALLPLGFKDYNAEGNGIDASNRADDIVIKNWPVFGMYQPDAAKAVEIDGSTYLLTANEGDARDYDFWSEEERIEDIDLDPTAFPNASDLQNEDSLGRLLITTTKGDIDGDGDFDELYNYGARSFSIWDANGALVYDSGDDFEQRTATEYPDNFNSTNDDNDSRKNRSDDKGPEPEAIEAMKFGDRTFVVIGNERMSNLMIYEITDPMNPEFIGMEINRDFSVDADNADAGDLGPEDIKFVDKANTPDGEHWLIVSNEVSGTISFYHVTEDITTSVKEMEKDLLKVYPNPATDVVNFSKPASFNLISVSGKLMGIYQNINSLNVSEFDSGVYFIQTNENEVVKLIVE